MFSPSNPHNFLLLFIFSLLSSCYDSIGGEWQDSWTMCDTSGSKTDSTCTPWGFTYTRLDTAAKKCPLDYGGSGNGCQPPNLITSLINIALNPASVNEPLYKGKQFHSKYLVLCLCVCFHLVVGKTLFYFERNTARIKSRFRVRWRKNIDWRWGGWRGERRRTQSWCMVSNTLHCTFDCGHWVLPIRNWPVSFGRNVWFKGYIPIGLLPTSCLVCLPVSP